MSEFITVIKRPYKVYTGELKYSDSRGNPSGIVYTFSRAFRSKKDAMAYAERESEDYEFVKVVEKEFK